MRFRPADEVLIPLLASHLEGLELVGFPAEPPWMEERPSWAIDATPDEERRLTIWLAWFYGFNHPFDPPSAPLSPRYRFTAIAPTLKIRVENGCAHFDPYPSSVAQFVCIRELARALCRWKRQVVPVQIDGGPDNRRWVEVEIWVRPEFVSLALTRFIHRDSRRNKASNLLPGGRGSDDLGGKCGVIPIDVDFHEGDHAPSADALRRPKRIEGPEVFALSDSRWGYEIEGGGGVYRYLKLREPIDFEDDPIRAKEILQGAQKELVNKAREKGLDVDLAFKGATSLCRVPFSMPTKYAWKHNRVIKLSCPDIEVGEVVPAQDLENLRELARDSKTRRKVRSHSDRRKTTGA